MSSPKVTIRHRPAIQDPTQDPISLQTSVSQLKEAVEIMQGQRGVTKLQSVVTWQDLLDLSLIGPERVPK